MRAAGYRARTARSLGLAMRVRRKFTAVVEKCTDTGLFVGYIPGFPGAHTQGATLDELAANLREVVELLLQHR